MSNVLIGDICYVFDGPHATPTKTPEGPIYLGIDAITENGRLNPNEYNHLSEEDYKIWTKRVIPQKDDIVFSYEATLGRYAMIPEDFYGCLGRRLAIVRAKDNRVNPRWLYYYFLSPEWKVFIANHTVRGSTVDRISVEDFPGYPVPLPMREVQDNVVNVLSKIDARIDTNIRICIELENVAKTLYDYWFTQFDFPNAEGKPYRSSGGAMEWNEQLKREIPKGWRCSVIANHIGDSKGGDWGKDTLTGNYQKEVVCIRGADFPSINGGKTLNAPVRYILSKNANKTLLASDIIVEISGGSPTQSTGRICYINDYTLRRFDKEIITSNFCKAFSTKKASEQYWLYLLWKTLYDAGVLFGFEGKTTGIKNLLFDDFCVQYRIVAPDNTVLQRFHETVSPIFEKIQQYNIENDELTKLRDWLLPMLMNGQATVVSAPSENKSQIPSEPEVIEVLQAARTFSGTQSTFDDTADLVRYYKEHK